MADRFPLIVNAVSQKIEEIVSGDNLELTGNGIVVSGDTGAGKYLTSNGTTVFWDSPGDVYLTQTQTLTNKTFEQCTLSGTLNTLTNIPNTALVNSGITVNGITIALGGSVTTPDNNTTYAISAQDGASATEKIFRLSSGGNAGAGVDDDIVFAVGSPSSVPSGSNALSLFLDRSGETITLSGHVVDNNTITTINAPGGSATSGAISFTSTGAATVSMTGSVVNVDALDTDTRTKIRAGSGGTYGPADTTEGRFTFLDGTGTSVSQGVDGSGDPTITYTSTDTVTQIRGGSTGTYTPSATGTASTQISIEGGTALGGNVQVSQSGNTILIDSTDTNTVTQIGSDNNGSPISPAAGDFIFKQAGATTITQTTNQNGEVEITVSSINSDTGASLDAGPQGGLVLNGTNFRLKNYNNLSGNTLMKWDNGNSQLADSIITDDGTTVTIDGDLVVEGTQTILNTSTLQVEDNIIELRKGDSLVGADGGIQVNRTSDASGVITAYKSFQWHESGGYWRSWDGSVENRFVTETETQVLTNKTLTNPTFTTPTLGAATATSVNGLEIASTASAVLDIQSGKTVDINNDLTFTSDNATGNVNVNFRVGGDVAYKSDTLASFASTTATQLRTLISGTTGVDDLVFQTNPVILTGLTTTSTGFALINSGAQSIQFGGAATQIDMGNSSGTTTISGDTVVEKDLTVGGASTDLLLCNARLDVANSDILIRGGTSDPMTIGRGTSAVGTNTAVGVQTLLSVSSGSQNTALGYQSVLTANTGAGNTGIGYHALRSTGVGDNNTAVGRSTMLSNLSGESNTAVGANALETNTTGDANVCIGFYAGYNVTGSGNVLIGPADSGNPINDATYSPTNPAGNRQLVIGSGTEYWVKGDANFDVTINNDLTVNSGLTVKGDLVVNGTTTTVKSNVVEIADKAIELAKVASTTFTCSTTDGSANISAISPTLGLIPGMVVASTTAGVSVPNGTTILSISGNSATLSNNVSGTGTPTFNAIGPSDTAADGGGIILAGNTNHTFTWSNTNDAWQSSEDMEVANGKTYNIIDGSGNAREMLSLTQIGPTAGTGVVAGLGTGVTSSSLTSVGTLSALTVSGNVELTGTGYLQLPSGTDGERPGTPVEGMLRWNDTSNVFEGYDGNVWGKIGGGAAVQSAAPSSANEGDLWYDTDDGRMFVYYNDGSSSQWVDASPNGIPTDLTLDGTLSVGGTTSLNNTTITDQLSIGSGSAANSEYGLIAYSNSSSLSNRSAVYARNLNAGGRTFTGDNDTGATTFEVYASGNIVSTQSSSSEITSYNTINSGTGSNRILIRTQANQGGDPYIKFDAGGSNMIVGEQYNGTTNNLLVLGVGESPGGVTGITINGNGQTVIGTHAMGSEQLRVKGGEADIWLDSSDSGIWRILGSTGGSTHMFRIYDNTNSADRLNINASGRVRLPAVPGVAGSNLANLQIEADGNLCTTTSIRAAKTNISPLEDTSWLFDLNPVTFNWRTKTENEDGTLDWGEEADGGTQYGLIAEEVEEVKDDFCYYNIDGELSGVHYDRLVAPLLKVVQQQKEEIEALKARLDAGGL